MVKFLAVADIHYSDLSFTVNPTDGEVKYHSMSLEKLENAIALSEDCDFAVNLGDLADNAENSRPQPELMREIISETQKSKLKFYHVIGNHDTAVKKRDLLELLGCENRYYSFLVNGIRFIVLDFAMNDRSEPMTVHEMDWKHPYIDDEQLQWLENEIKKGDETVIFTHFPVLVDSDSENLDERGNYTLCNRRELLSIITKKNVTAVISGHMHCGSFREYSGVPFVTLRSIAVEKSNNFSKITVGGGRLHIEGFGLQESID